jgi:hypothetical protein
VALFVREVYDRKFDSIRKESIIDPVSIVANYVSKKVLKQAETAVRHHVIERWSRYRAQQFFDAFCQSLLDTGISNEDIGKKLDELLEDEANSEIVFEAYRTVCLTKSKSLGPRIIALLTAELIVAKSKANRSNQFIFDAAEELSDSELKEFAEFAHSYIVKSQMEKYDDVKLLDGGTIEIRWCDHSPSNGTEIPVGPLNLASDIGTWALKLKRIGLISDSVTERQWSFKEDSERYIDEPGIARQVTCWLLLTKESQVLAILIRRASVSDDEQF